MVENENVELIDIDDILAKTCPGTASQINRDLLKYVQTLSQHVRRLDEEVQALKGVNRELESKIEGMQRNNVAHPTTVSAELWSQLKQSKDVRSDINSIISREKVSVEKKEKNLIVFGLEKGTNDKAAVKEIFEVIEVEVEEFKVHRFRDGKEGKPGPLVVEFKDVDNKMKVLKEARKLRNSKFDKVFINQDLTESEMVRDRDLRRQRMEANAKLPLGDGNLKYGMSKFGDEQQESKFYWGIRNGELRKIKKL